MDIYEIILEALQYQVDNGELTLEEAEEVNTLAYDRYVSEGNAYNKLLDKRTKEIDKNIKNIEKYGEIQNKLGYNQNAKETYDKKIVNLYDKNRYLNNIGLPYGACDTRKLQNSLNHKIKTERPKNKKRYLNDTSEYDVLKSRKNNWMSSHGNDGTRPEEKYNAGRYLSVQQIKKSIED